MFACGDTDESNGAAIQRPTFDAGASGRLLSAASAKGCQVKHSASNFQRSHLLCWTQGWHVHHYCQWAEKLWWMLMAPRNDASGWFVREGSA